MAARLLCLLACLAGLAQAQLDPNAKANADRIISFITGPAANQTYNKLAEFVDTIGNRVSGSQNLQNAVAYMLQKLQEDGLENVHGEDVSIPNWVRGNEYAAMVKPRPYNMHILGLGGSVGTGPDGIQASIVVVTSFDDLHAKAALNLTQGKIVVYNQYCDWVSMPVDCYGTSVAYRGAGASEAARAGAVAALVKSVTSQSLYTPHTGMQTYQAGVQQIPVASVTVEDAEMFSRMQARGVEVVVHLYMEAQLLPNVISQNVVAEWTGTTYPDEIVLVSGHLDSWDVGQGAMDDGGGAVASWQVLSALRQMGLRAKRTIRLVMWSCEEFGGIGSQQYFNLHKVNQSKFSLVMESDMGTFTPFGIKFSGSPSANATMLQVASLLTPINADQVAPGGAETDTGPWANIGVPSATLDTDNEKYFWYHHSNADTMSVYEPLELDLSAATLAVTAFTVADMPSLLPRN